MQLYCNSLTSPSRLKTREVKIGDLLLGNYHPIRLQTMTTTDTMDTQATVQQTIRCIEAGAELVRITAPSKKEAENLLTIKNELHKRGYRTPLVADIHFTPNAAEIAARIVEKVRVNPGNYVDKKKFEVLEYTDADYQEEIERIANRFRPLVAICKEYGTAMRIGTNHGSLSDRIMSRYGDTPMGMVESAMEFLRIARHEAYHNIVLSMKSSNPQVMVQAYRLLISKMEDEFGECYPLHLGVTEAGDGEDGRIKSAAGIGTLLEDGIGDTIRVSLTEDPELEIPVCRDLVKRYQQGAGPESLAESFIAPSSMSSSVTSFSVPSSSVPPSSIPSSTPSSAPSSSIPASSIPTSILSSIIPPSSIPSAAKIPYDPFNYRRRTSFSVSNTGHHQVPVVIADLSRCRTITPETLENAGYKYDNATDKWHISDLAADYVLTGKEELPFALPGSLKVITWPNHWEAAADKTKYFPVFSGKGFTEAASKSNTLNFVMLECFNDTVTVNDYSFLDELANDPSVVICLSSTHPHETQAIRRMFIEIMSRGIQNPVVIFCQSNWKTTDEHLIHFSTVCGALLLDGMGDGICLSMSGESYELQTASFIQTSGRNYTNTSSAEAFLNNTSFGILQATRTRISKTEYISCPSCGRTLFDLQETTARIRAVTNHLKGLKIAVMGCIVNGPGEMADADFGYVGSGPGKITLYKGKEVVKRSVDSSVAVEELINLLKENNVWSEP